MSGFWWKMPEDFACDTMLSVAAEAKSTPQVVLTTFVMAGSHASRQSDRGSIATLDVGAICACCSVSGWEIWRILAAFTRRGLIIGDRYEIEGQPGELPLIIGRRMSGDWPKAHNGSGYLSAPAAADDRDDRRRQLARLRTRRWRERRRVAQAISCASPLEERPHLPSEIRVTSDASPAVTAVTSDVTGVTGDAGDAPPCTPLSDLEPEGTPLTPRGGGNHPS